MARITFDLDALRSFVVGIELGGFAKAADRLGRSTSAVSAQLKKLEIQVGAPILRKAGRGLVLTPTGETVLAYARRLIELNDEAVALRLIDQRAHSSSSPGAAPCASAHFASRMLDGTNRVAIGYEGE